jgi:hypothetical protein
MYVERFLFDHASTRPNITLRFGHEVTSFGQDKDGVTLATIRLSDGRRGSWRADYLAGCDGGRSFVRRTLGLSTTVADARFAKPLDTELVLRLAREHEVLITIEEGSIGGFGSIVLQTLAENGVLDAGLKVRSMVLPDTFIDQDTPAAMYATAHLDAKGIVAKVFEALGKDAAAETVKLA